MGVEFGERLAALTETIYKLGGRKFNVKSPKQLSAVLFDEMKLPVIKRTKSGYSTNAEVLQRLAEKGHEIADVILEHRKLAKLINTYTDVLTKAVHPRTGRIHCTFQQTVSATGRLITTDPDLQRTPVNTAEGLRIRRAFTAPVGTIIVSADWSQIELRLLAHVSEDPLLLDAYVNDLDIHRRTAGQIFDLDPGDVDDKQRGVGKTVNFATIYGQGATALGQQLRVPRKEAQRYIDTYFEAYSGVRAWLDATMEQAHGDGFVTTLLGRRRYIPELSSNSFMERTAGERIAANTPIQGSAADICKLAMILIANRIREEQLTSRMLLQIHDELVFEVPTAEKNVLTELVRHEMESVVALKVPLKVDIGHGPDWGGAKG